MKGLDLKRLKKTKSDDKSSTFQHPDGHLIIVAHAKLSPKFKSELDKMPLHGGQKMAQGGRVQNYDNGGDVSQDSGDKPPVTINIGNPSQGVQMPQGAMSPEQQQSLMSGGKQAPAQDPGFNVENVGAGNQGLQFGSGPDQSQQQDASRAPLGGMPSIAGSFNQSEAPPAPEPANEAPQDQGGQPSAADTAEAQNQMEDYSSPDPTAAYTPQAVKSTLTDESQKFAQDLANQHITPETYSTLFHKESTLGQIGTLFGLLASGIGSGLTHQPNAVLGMMGKTIDNDLEAQKSSKVNAQNFLRINQQNEFNKANVNNLVQQGKVNAATAENIKQQTLLNAWALTKNQMNFAGYHHVAQIAAGLPDKSMTQAQAQAALPMMFSAMTNENSDAIDKATAGAAMMNMGNSGGGGSDMGLAASGPTGANMVNYKQTHSVTGIPGMSNRPIPEDTQKQIQAMNVLDNKGKDVLGFVQQHKGTWNPQTQAQAEQKVEEMKNFYNNSIQGGALTEGRLGWYDKQFSKEPTSIVSQMLGSTSKLQEMVNSNASRRDQLLSSFNLKPPGSGQPQEQYKTVNGVKYKRGPNGEAVKVQ